MSRYDRIQIYELVWEIGADRTAKKLNIDVSLLRKICKALHIPVPSQGYWSAVGAGNPVEPPPPLPRVRIAETGKVFDGLVAPRLICISALPSVPSEGCAVRMLSRGHTLPDEPHLGLDELPGTFKLYGQSHSEEQTCAAHIGPIGLNGLNDVYQADDGDLTKFLGQTQQRGEEADCSSETVLPKVSASLISRYKREQLYEEIWKSPMRNVAKEYGVSDVALAKTCRKLYIPIPSIGYWNRIAAGQPVQARPSLPQVEVVAGLPRREGRMHTLDQARILFQQIQQSVSVGMTVGAACREVQVDLSTYVRWRKRNERGDRLVVLEPSANPRVIRQE
jgi:hypothetical protein